MQAATLNVNGRSPAAPDLSQWLRVHPEPDIVAVGFQEIVPLSASNVVMGEFCRPLLSRRSSHSAPAMSSWVGADGLCSEARLCDGAGSTWPVLEDHANEETAPPSQLSLRQSSVLSGNYPRAAQYGGAARKPQIHSASRQGCSKEVPAWTQTMLQESTRCLMPDGGGSILPAQQVLLAPHAGASLEAAAKWDELISMALCGSQATPQYQQVHVRQPIPFI